MALKAPTSNSSNRTPQAAMEGGSYPARIVRILDLGEQPQVDYATKEPKAPAQMISVTWEFVDEFMLDADGNPQEDKPRWLSEDFKLMSLSSDLATSTKRMKAIDPKNEFDGDWSLTLGAPGMVVVGQYETKKNPGVMRNKILNVTTPRARDIAGMPELKNPPKFFDLSDPDIEFFKSLPQWQQDVIKGNVRFVGSLLEQRLNGAAPAEAPKEKPAPQKAAEPTPEQGDDGAPW